MTRVPQLLVWAVVGLLVLVGCGRAPTPRPDPAVVRDQLARASTAVSTQVLQRLVERDGPDDPRYYADGVFRDGDTGCFRCHYGGAVLSVTYGVVHDDAEARRRGVESLDRAVRTAQGADGAFRPPAPGEDGPGIQTTLFGLELAQAYLVLGPALDPATAERWRASLRSAVGYLQAAGSTTWYANGNLVLAQTVLMDLTYVVTGEQTYRDAADVSYAFLVAPDQVRWPGFGLSVTTAPTRADGSDGAGYLTEKGAAATPGFDASYAMVQLNLATAWFVLSGRPEALRLSNLLVNALLPRVRTEDWTIPIEGGTRKSGAEIRYGFYVSGLPVLALSGGRSDLLAQVGSQEVLRGRNYVDSTRYPNVSWSFNYGAELAVVLWAAHRPR